MPAIVLSNARNARSLRLNKHPKMVCVLLAIYSTDHLHFHISLSQCIEINYEFRIICFLMEFFDFRFCLINIGIV